MQKLIIPCQLPSLNETIAKSKRHWSEYHRSKREYTALIATLARRELRPVRNQRIYLSCVWYTANKRSDPDNIASAKKFILDGLVQAGILENDSQKFISGFADRFEVDRRKPRVEVCIEIEQNANENRTQNDDKTATKR